MEEQNNQIRPKLLTDPDEINLLEYFYVLVKNKWLIIGLTVLGFIGGYLVALSKGPQYIADAVITPRKAESVKTPNLSGLGMLGGVVASQLNVSGNASLEKVDLILNSRKFNAELVEKKGLLPLLFPEQWDSLNDKWVNGFQVPEFIAAGGYLRGEFLEKEINNNGTMTISIENEDSLFSYKMLHAYLEYLDEYIKEDIQKDAKENRDYLENQLVNITDPLLRAKIQELIAKEVERMMVVSKEAFKVLDPVFTYKSFKEKKLFPALFALGFLFLIVLILILKQAFLAGDKTEEDKILLKDIKREIIKLPFR